MPAKLNLSDKRTTAPKLQPNWHGISALVLFLTTIAFAGLWWRQLRRLPIRVEIVREVIKNVPREVIKPVEVPAKSSEAQAAEIALGRKFMLAPVIPSADGALYKLRAVKVQVKVEGALKQMLYDERIRSKLESVLLRSNIVMDAQSPVTLSLEIDGRWDEDQARLTYTTRLRVYDLGFLARGGDIRKGTVEVWTSGRYGYAGKAVVEEAVSTTVERLGETFAQRLAAERQEENPNGPALHRGAKGEKGATESAARSPKGEGQPSL